MNKSRTASDILLAGIPEARRENSESVRTRKKYINDITRVRNDIMGIVSLVSGISVQITPEVKKTNDKVLIGYIDKLIDKTNLIQTQVDKLDVSLAELKQIEDDESFIVTSFSVIEQASCVLSETQEGYVDVYESAASRIKELTSKESKKV